METRGAAKKRRLSPEAEAGPHSRAPGAAKKRRCLPTWERSGGGGGEAEKEGEGGSVPGWGSAELETMIKPDRIRDCGAETGREANNKNRNSPGEETEVHPPLCEPDDRAVLRHARQDMRGVGGNFAPKLFSSCSSVINWCILGFLLVLAVRFSLL
jgi:hypothetical protein